MEKLKRYTNFNDLKSDIELKPERAGDSLKTTEEYKGLFKFFQENLSKTKSKKRLTNVDNKLIDHVI